MLRKIIVLLMLLLVLVPPLMAQEPTSTTHTVAEGETLYRIATRYGLTINEVAVANGITNTAMIYSGQVLVIPTGGTAPAANAAPPTETNPTAPDNVAPAVDTTTQTHVVQRGETLAAIARKYGVTWTDLAIWNNISNPNTVLVGQQLVVRAPGTAPVPETQPAPVAEATTPPAEAAPANPVEPAAPAEPATPNQRQHIVQRNEGLSTIAREYGVSWVTLAQVNNISNPNTIYPGQVLTIPNPTLNPPADFGQAASPTSAVDNGRMILVELSKQQISAYENGQLVRQVTVSTGLPGTPTVTGDYYIYTKLPSQTMYGPGYYLPGVPWVMYFYQGYAIHGTYWHNNFGQPMSHGCVNLPTDEAEWFYNFASVGTLVRVQS